VATHAETMLAAIQAAQAENPGVLSITTDGVTVRYESTKAMNEARRGLVAEVNRERGRRPAIAQIRLDTAW